MWPQSFRNQERCSFIKTIFIFCRTMLTSRAIVSKLIFGKRKYPARQKAEKESFYFVIFHVCLNLMTGIGQLTSCLILCSNWLRFLDNNNNIQAKRLSNGQKRKVEMRIFHLMARFINVLSVYSHITPDNYYSLPKKIIIY